MPKSWDYLSEHPSRQVSTIRGPVFEDLVSEQSTLLRMFNIDNMWAPDKPYISQFNYATSGLFGRRKKVETKWTRKRAIGKGVLGLVWLEENMQLDTFRIVKQVSRRSMEALRIDYKKEILTWIRLARHNREFVEFQGYFENETYLFITMEYIPLGDLRQYIPLGIGIDEQEVGTITRQLLDGLHILHSNNLVHKDLNLSNILVVSKGPKWKVKISDFGFAKRVNSYQASHDLGSGMAYQSPESLGITGNLEKFSYTSAVDMWSLGCVTYKLLTNLTPFSSLKALESFCFGPAPFPTEELLTRLVSPKGVEFIHSLLRVSPNLRPSAEAIRRHPWISSSAISPPRYESIEPRSSEHRSQPHIEDVTEYPSSLFLNGKSTKEKLCRNNLLEETPEALEILNTGEKGGVVSEKSQSILNDPVDGSFSDELPPYSPQKEPTRVYSVEKQETPQENVVEFEYLGRTAIDYRTIKLIRRLRRQVSTDLEADKKLREQVISSLQLAEAHVLYPGAGREDVLGMLQSYGYGPKWYAGVANRALIFAIEHGNDQAVRAALEVGADANHRVSETGHVLHLAGFKSHVTIQLILIANGANVSTKNVTPLHRASHQDHPEMAYMLIESGADINAKTNLGWTALHLAVRKQRYDIIRLLLAKGADPEIEDINGITPVDLLHEYIVVSHYQRTRVMTYQWPLTVRDRVKEILSQTFDENRLAADGYYTKSLRYDWTAREGVRFYMREDQVYQPQDPPSRRRLLEHMDQGRMRAISNRPMTLVPWPGERDITGLSDTVPKDDDIFGNEKNDMDEEERDQVKPKFESAFKSAAPGTTVTGPDGKRFHIGKDGYPIPIP